MSYYSSIYYSSISRGYDRLYKDEQLKKLKIIKDNLEIKKNDRLLDVGCGTGFSLDFFACDCTGLEPSREMAEGNPKIVIGEAEKIPFPSHSFDIVICVTALHNFKDFRKGLEEMKRIGKERFAFSVLKRAKSFYEIRESIKKIYVVKKEIEEEKDIIFISSLVHP